MSSMMAGEVYHLARKDYISSMNNTFKEMMDNTDMADVTLACDDNSFIKAHKIILSSNSDFFRNIVSRSSNQNIFIYLKGIKKEDMTSIIKFIYLGETNVVAENLDSFLEAAQQLQIRGLIDILGRDGVDYKKDANELLTNGQQNKAYQGDEAINIGDSDSSKLDLKNITLPYPTSSVTNNIDFQLFNKKEPEEIAFTNEDSTFSETLKRDIKKEINMMKVENTKIAQNQFIEKHEINFKREPLDEFILPFECKKCSYKSVDYANLKLHDLAIHRNSKYPCDNCDFHTNKRPAFIEHMQERHSTNISF